MADKSGREKPNSDLVLGNSDVELDFEADETLREVLDTETEAVVRKVLENQLARHISTLFEQQASKVIERAMATVITAAGGPSGVASLAVTFGSGGCGSDGRRATGEHRPEDGVCDVGRIRSGGGERSQGSTTSRFVWRSWFTGEYIFKFN